MKRLLIIYVLFLALLAVASSVALAERSAGKEKVAKGGMSVCVSECGACRSECEQTLSYCLKQGGQYKEAKHIQALRDCIAACKISHDFMSSGSDLSNRTCALCAEACQRCAASCATFKDKAMQQCADECKKCEQSCASMSH